MQQNIFYFGSGWIILKKYYGISIIFVMRTWTDVQLIGFVTGIDSEGRRKSCQNLRNNR